MKKICIITLNGLDNFGNRLQCYGLTKFISSLGVKSFNYYYISINTRIKNILKYLLPLKRFNRYKRFLSFNRRIPRTNKKNGYDYYIVGSDQVWNPNFGCSNDLLLDFCDNSVKVSYSASIGENSVSDSTLKLFEKYLTNFKALSVRETNAKEILFKATGRIDIEVLIDPTMLLTSNNWECISKRPKKLKKQKYVLNYFLGSVTDNRKKAIELFAEENDCYIVNVLDKCSPFYNCGPSEFLYLEKHAEMIFTDSFHSSVFAFLFDRPFVVFDREQDGMENMGSRLDTLLSKFKLDNRKFNGIEITEENYKHDYTEGYKILEVERIKANKFLKRALDIEGE